jgi:starch-binding outer membrane protein, SusD/RagB family
MKTLNKRKIEQRLVFCSIISRQTLPLIAIMLMAIIFSGCQKLINVKLPVDELTTPVIFTDSATAQAAVNGMYSQLYNGEGTGTSFYSYRISLLPAESADEMVPVKNTFDYFYTNSLVANNSDINDLWSNSYNVIYLANSIINGVQSSTTLSSSLKKQLTGEAEFVRAFCDFYLVNYFGKVPLITTTDITVTNNAPASTTDQVYAQIITDLTNARDALAKDYSWSGGDRTRVNTYVASAMLARVYLYTSQWALAETEATKVIGQNGLYTLVTDPNNVFLANSQEALWQFYTNVYGYTYFASNVFPTGAATPNYAINSTLYNTFEPGDSRKSKWINSVTVMGITYTFPYKYKSVTDDNTEYDMVLRLAEQYLIRAEASAQQNDISGAVQDLNMIRTRAGLPGTTAADKASLLLAIEHERQVELFCEYGHRWLDLKRTNRADAVLGSEKPAWKSTDILYPIPLSATGTNPKLSQNPGY